MVYIICIEPLETETGQKYHRRDVYLLKTKINDGRNDHYQ